MTPAEARRIDREEFEAECAAIRQRAYHFVEQRRHAARAEIAHWLGRQAPAFRFVAPYTPKATLQPKPKMTRPKREVGQPHIINGLSLTMAEWAEHLGIGYIALCGRVHRLGSIEAAIAAGKGNQRGKYDRRKAGLTPGVSSNLAPSKETGAWSVLQETPNITFSNKAEIA